MRQSRAMSMLEVITNVGVGLGLAVLMQIIVFPVYGLRISALDNLKISLAFTVLSLVRGYTLRRLFDRRARRS